MAATVYFDLIEENKGSFYVFESGSDALRTVGEFELAESGELLVSDMPEDFREAFLGLPLELIDFRLLELPLNDRDRIRDILPFELDGLVLGGTEDAVIDDVVIGPEPSGEKNIVLAAYMKKETLRRLIGAFSTAGYDPRAVTSLELAHVLEESQPDRDALGRMLLEQPRLEERERRVLANGTMKKPPIDLRRGEFTYTRSIKRAQRSINFAVMAVALLVLVVAGDISLRTTQVRKETARVEAEIVKAYSEMFPGEKLSGTAGLSLKLKSKMKEVSDKDAALSGIAPLDFLMKLKEATPNNIEYREVTLDREYVSLEGEAPSLAAVEDARRKLETQFTDVKITESGPAASGRYAFSIAAKDTAK